MTLRKINNIYTSLMNIDFRFIIVNLLDEIEANYDFTKCRPELHGLSTLKDIR